MTIYINSVKDSPITSVEFTPTIDGNFSFFHVKDAANVEAVKQQLAAIGDAVIAETTVGGRPMLIARGARTDYGTLNALKDAGFNLTTPPKAESGIKPWKLRGWASMIGQPLQILSGFMTKGRIDSATIGFGSLNMIANIANIVFGAEQTKDTNQLRFLKRKFNYELSQYLPDQSSSKLPSSYDDRIHLRGSKEKPPSLGTRTYDFLRRHSVSFCEIGLRYVGSIFLFFPFDQWGSGLHKFGENLRKSQPDPGKPNFNPNKASLKKAISEGSKAAFNSKDPYSAYVGMAYVAGKTLAFTSKVPDPYDNKPHTWMDTFREKVVFRLSSAIEASAAGLLAYDRLLRKVDAVDPVTKQPIMDAKTGKQAKKFARTITYNKLIDPFVNTVRNNTKEGSKIRAFFMKYASEGKGGLEKSSRDWVGGIGGLLFTFGLIIRIFAKFGDRKVDMEELQAHLVDGLAQVPHDKLPKLIADFSAYLTEHFKGQVEFGQVYKEMADGLYRYHQIALPGLNPIQDARAATQQNDLTAKDIAAYEADPITKPAAGQDDTAEKDEKSFARQDMKSNNAALSRAANTHIERVVAKNEPSPALGA